MRRRRLVVAAAVIAVALVAAVGVPGAVFLTRDEPEVYANIVQQFKYGSSGAEADQGIPYHLWAVLPEVFPDLLPPGPGNGYARFGFIYEQGQPRPIGLGYRKKPIGLVGLNCATCHTGTVRESPNARRQIVLGMPANRLRLQAYIDFFRRVGKDRRFNADTLMPAIEARFPHLSWFQRRFYRYVVIREARIGLHELDRDFAWMDRWPTQGPGRVSTFTAWKVKFGYDQNADDLVGTTELPSIWNQGIRRGLPSHWDGNNSSLLERNLSAAMAIGASEESVDLPSIQRIDRWLLGLHPARFPEERIDRSLVARGEPQYEQHCASCHEIGGSRIGRVTPLAEIGTDPERLRSFTAELSARLNEVGEGRWWAFSHFRKTNGYANQPLDGIWLRAPYLHNGSVPTLRALLFPAERPAVFYTGYDVYDWSNVGFVAGGSAARREGFRYDTRIQGNHNTGHLYGTRLPARQREAIIEYLKTK